MTENDDFQTSGVSGSLRQASIPRDRLQSFLGALADWGALFPETRTVTERRAR